MVACAQAHVAQARDCIVVACATCACAQATITLGCLLISLICNKTGYRIHCSKVKPEVNYRYPIQGSHITIDLYYRNMFLWGFCILHFPDRADFLITKIDGHDKYFEQKIPVVLDS